MRSILCQFGSFTLHSYTTFVLLGVGLALSVVRFQLRRRGAPLSLLWGALLWTLAGGLAVSRALYVALYWQDFKGDLLSSLQIERGGLIWYGGLIGGTLALYLYARHNRLSFWQWADVAAPAVALGYAVGQIGCLLSSFCYGVAYDGPLNLELPDVYGLVDYRYPTQLMASAANLAIAIILWRTRRNRPFVGFSSLLYLVLFSLAQGFLEFTRGDESLYLGDFRLTQAFSWTILAIGIAGMALSWRRRDASKSLASPLGAPGR